MDIFIIYIIKCAICFTIFYLCVKVLLSNETFFRFNRWVILIGAAVCLILPLVQIKVTSDKESVFRSPIAILERTLTETVPISKPIPSTETNMQKTSNYQAYDNHNLESVKIGILLLYVYTAGMVINMFILFRSAYLMISLIRRGRKKLYPNYTLVLISEDIVPFSWGKYIVLSVSDYENNPDEIIIHEIAHTRYRHSLDLIFMELVLLLQWFNPAIWLLKRELKDIHEYQADISVLQSGINATKYQLLLVKKAVGASSYTLANSFNHSKIKKRITMMLKEKSNKWTRLKLLMLLPLGTLTVFAFARPEVNEPLTSMAAYESTNILRDTEISKKEIIKVTPPVIQLDTVPKNKVVFVPPPPVKATKQSGSGKTVKFVQPVIQLDTVPKNKVVFVPPPPVKTTKQSGEKKTIKFAPPVIKKDGPKNTQKKKETPPPPPPIKKKEVEKKDGVIIVEDVEGKKEAK
ncbi:MAG: M56 family metallopeptidase [Dysgonomonas sp.]